MTTETLPAWTRCGRLGRVAASLIRPKEPPVLVLSLPRSGSSWVGWTLGSAHDARYLREPFTQGDPAINAKVVFEPELEPELEPILRRLADHAFHSLPDHRPDIMQCSEQWALKGWHRRRLVVKEVNPRGCRWFIDRYQPKVVFLVRHPAAVCWSSQREGWLGKTSGDWRVRGLEDGESLRQAFAALERHKRSSTIAVFETLCERPLEEFRRLYDFTGLIWDGDVEKRVTIDSAKSPSKRDAWRSQADPECVAALRESFETFGLDIYRGDDAWRLEPQR